MTVPSILDGGKHRGKGMVAVGIDDVVIVRGETMAEQVGEVLRESRVVSAEGALDAKRGLVLRDQESRRDHDQGEEHARQDSVIPRKVLPPSSIL